MQQKKVLQSVTGLILALAMILVILITSFQYAAYGVIPFTEKSMTNMMFIPRFIWNPKKS